MKKQTLHPQRSPIWNFQLSGINWAIEKRLYLCDSMQHNDHFKINSGLKMVLITTMASVIEGMLKEHFYFLLESEKNKTISNKQEQNPKLKVILIENDWEKKLKLNSISNTEWVFIKNLILKNSEIIKDNKEISKIEFVDSIGINFKIKVNIKDLTKSKLDEANWSFFKKLFMMINCENPISFENTLKADAGEDLFESIDIIFQFRNAFAHSNSFEFDWESELNSYEYKSRTEKFHSYLKKYDLLNSNSENLYSVERFITDELIVHLAKEMNRFIELKRFHHLRTTFPYHKLYLD